MNASRVGKAAEAKVRAVLERNGYELISSHLSRGPVDVLAGKPGQLLAVQVKRQRTPGPGEWNEICRWALAFGAIPIVAFAPPRQPVTFWRITGRKSGAGERQPWEPFVLDEIAEVS